MKRFSVVIADKSDTTKSNIQALLDNYQQFEAIALAYNIKEINDICHNLQADVLFLNENTYDDRDLLTELVAKLPSYTHIIYLSSDERNAATAFDHGFIDYLITPFDADRFHKSLFKVLKHLEHNSHEPLRDMQSMLSQLAVANDKEEIIVVKDSGRIRIIDRDEIVWIGGAGNYVELHLTDETRPMLHRETLSTMEKLLKENGFIRIHRSALVKKREIRELKPTENGDYLVTLRNGASLNLSRRYKESMSGILK